MPCPFLFLLQSSNQTLLWNTLAVSKLTHTRSHIFAWKKEKTPSIFSFQLKSREKLRAWGRPSSTIPWAVLIFPLWLSLSAPEVRLPTSRPAGDQTTTICAKTLSFCLLKALAYLWQNGCQETLHGPFYPNCNTIFHLSLFLRPIQSPLSHFSQDILTNSGTVIQYSAHTASLNHLSSLI